MNLQQMEYIVALDKYRHFVLAAEACGVTQPTLSAMIQKLEEELDVKVFNRDRKNITPTPIGEKIIRQAQIALNETQRIKELVADADEVLRFYSAVMRGEVKDQFGLDASLTDRLKAGDALMKRYAAGGSKKNETEDDPITRSLKEDVSNGLL